MKINKNKILKFDPFLSNEIVHKVLVILSLMFHL